MDNEGLICENCNRRVPSENYEMHFVHCKRNLKLCSLCGEAIQRSREKEHFEENHAEKTVFSADKKQREVKKAIIWLTSVESDQLLAIIVN